MNMLEFISSLIQSVTWPLVVTTMVILFREHLVQFIYSIRRISFREVRVDVGDRLTEIESTTDGQALSLAHEPADKQPEGFKELQKQVEEVSAVCPKASILYTWAIVEKELRAIIEQHSFLSNRLVSDWKWLKKKKVLDRHMIKLLYKLHHLHEDVATNQKAHEVTPTDAKRFFELAQAVLKVIREKKERL